MTTTEYNTCVDTISDGLYRFLLKQTNQSDIAKDIVQDCYEKLWLNREAISLDKAKSFLFTTGYNRFVDLYRRSKFQTSIEGIRNFDLIGTNSYSDIQDILNSALMRLPEIQKTVLLLRDYEGYDYDEIGKITGLNESQVKVYIYRARVQVKDFVKNLSVAL